MQIVAAQVHQLVPAPVLGICVWSSLSLLLWSLWITVKEAAMRLKRLHQIPCHRCLYFTGDYRLKCTVNPCTALSEAAIDCRDFAPAAYPRPLAQDVCKRCKS